MKPLKFDTFGDESLDHLLDVTRNRIMLFQSKLWQERVTLAAILYEQAVRGAIVTPSEPQSTNLCLLIVDGWCLRHGTRQLHDPQGVAINLSDTVAEFEADDRG